MNITKKVDYQNLDEYMQDVIRIFNAFKPCEDVEAGCDENLPYTPNATVYLTYGDEGAMVSVYVDDEHVVVETSIGSSTDSVRLADTAPSEVAARIMVNAVAEVCNG